MVVDEEKERQRDKERETDILTLFRTKQGKKAVSVSK